MPLHSTGLIMAALQESIHLEPPDFFISYTGVDEQAAECIAWHLEEAGYSVIFQKWGFCPGHNFVIRMQEAVTRAQKIIVVLSRAYEEALYTRVEWTAIFVGDPTGNERRLIPVRV